MKLIIPILILVLFACQKESIDFDYDYKIQKIGYTGNTQFDSTVYYYDKEKRLLKVEFFSQNEFIREYNTIYEDDCIYIHKNKYTLNSEGHVILVEFGDNFIELEYESNNVSFIKEAKFANGLIDQEYNKFYQNGCLVKDSIVSYQSNGDDIVTEYIMELTDTLAENFMVDFSGLYEMPKRSNRLIRQAKCEEHGFLVKYSYKISENEIIQVDSLYVNSINPSIYKTIYRIDIN